MPNSFIDMSMRLSAHFTLGEMCYSNKAANHKPKPRPNIPLKQNIVALKNLCERCLEPVRQQLGLPLQVNSGYRCPMVNTLVRGVPTSQHMKGEAADITIPRKHRPFSVITDEQAARLIFLYARQFANFDQLILEHNATAWWVHISCRIDYRKNRHQIINDLIKNEHRIFEIASQLVIDARHRRLVFC